MVKKIVQKIQSLLSKPHRLSMVLMVLIGAWLIGAILLVGLSLNMSWRLEDRGTAINEAGSLRKRVFHMMLLTQYQRDQSLLEDEYNQFQDILENLNHLNNNGFVNQKRYPSLEDSILNVRRQFNNFWQEIENKINQQPPKGMYDYFPQAEALTEQISQMVSLIEVENTNSIKMLRWFQLMLILMALISAIASSILLKYFVVLPLRRLDNGIIKISEGHLDTKITLSINNEFGRVAEGFNQMSSRLNSMYDNLEEMVFNKTIALRKRNHDLAFLYEMASIMQKINDQHTLCDVFLNKLIQFCGANSGSVRLLNKNSNQMELISSVNLPEELLKAKQCSHLSGCYCGKTYNQEQQYISFNLLSEKKHTSTLCHQLDLNHFFIFHIRVAEEKIGIVNLYFPDAGMLDEENAQLVDSLTGQLGIAIESIRLNQVDRYMAVLEERNLMAQGLHDSIAQSLSFLNMQVQVLEQALNSKNELMTTQALNFIEEGVQGCYDDVRELLTNFRVRLTRGSFKETVDSVMERFKRQTSMPIDFAWQAEGNELDTEEQLQALFILQEALSNIRKHAEASYVHIHLEQNHDQFELVIKDNGQGFNLQELVDKESRGHVGTRIMKERASKVNGLLTIQSEIGHGTQVRLVINRKIDNLKG